MFRNSLLILLIFLLPIRSWASESMGLTMAESTHSMEMVTEGDFSHCEMMQSDSTSPHSHSEHHDKPACQACTLCMAFAFAVPLVSMNTNDYSHQLAMRNVLFIDSAPLALPLKPPIF